MKTNETPALHIWEPEGAIRGIVQLVHGMAEHIGRYDRLARALNSRGYLVAGHNHRGHGPDAPLKGWFAEKDGWSVLIEDMHAVTLQLKQRYPGIPLVLLGHSMGSFAAREYALRYGHELQGLVLSGTGWYGKPLCLAGLAAAKLSSAKKPARFVDKLAFSGNNHFFHPARTKYDWLSRDNSEIDAYIADPDCGFVFTGQAYRDFFGGLLALTDTKRLSEMPFDLPVLFISGAADPVGQMGKGVEKVAAQMRRAGMQHITVRLYSKARHEMFHELNRMEADAYLGLWLYQNIISNSASD